MTETQQDHGRPVLLDMGGVTFLNFIDRSGQERMVNIKDVTGMAPDNYNRAHTAIWTINASRPLVAPYPMTTFSDLGVDVEDLDGEE